MTTLAFPSLPLTGLLAALRRAWPVALAEAVLGAMAALLLGPAAIDAEIAFTR
jgi:hypothetical protein